MLEQAIERPTRTYTTEPARTTNVSAGLLLMLAASATEDDAAMDAESILEQAEEANALDPV